MMNFIFCSSEKLFISPSVLKNFASCATEKGSLFQQGCGGADLGWSIQKTAILCDHPCMWRWSSAWGLPIVPERPPWAWWSALWTQVLTRRSASNDRTAHLVTSTESSVFLLTFPLFVCFWDLYCTLTFLAQNLSFVTSILMNNRFHFF